MAKLIDLTGKTFGKLTVIERAKNRGKHTIWVCKCECGNIVKVRSSHLITGNTKSCGCLRGHSGVHYLAHHRIYRIWTNMKSRCYNKNTINYNRYGGKGIIVCEEWKNFETFKNWAFKNGYKDDLTLDRINSNGNYEPDNCRWATVKNQCRNTKANKLISYKGETRCVAEWAEILGIDRKLIYDRLRKNWTIEEVFETPLLRRNKVGHKGITLTPYGHYHAKLQINNVIYNKTFKLLEDAINYRDEILNGNKEKDI